MKGTRCRIVCPSVVAVHRPRTAEANGGHRRACQHVRGTAIRGLVVDDEPSLAELVSMMLRMEGWEVRTAADGGGAIRQAREFHPDVVVLDVMLPDLHGLEVLRQLRIASPGLPVLLLTAKDAVEDRIAGLTAGGDDYVTKPFSLEEVTLRLRGLLRRSRVSAPREAELVVGDLV